MRTLDHHHTGHDNRPSSAETGASVAEGKERETGNAGRATLDEDTPDTVRLTVAEATALGEQALKRVGYDGDGARIIVDQLVDNALCGYKFAGLPRILAIAGDEKTRRTRSPVKTVHETPVSALLDGGNNVGYIVAYRA